MRKKITKKNQTSKADTVSYKKAMGFDSMFANEKTNFTAGITVFIAVTGLSFGYGAIRGILAESPVYDPSMMKPTEYFSSIYNSHGEVVQQLIGPASNRIRVTYDELPADLVNAFRRFRPNKAAFLPVDGGVLAPVLRLVHGQDVVLPAGGVRLLLDVAD